MSTKDNWAGALKNKLKSHILVKFKKLLSQISGSTNRRFKTHRDNDPFKNMSYWIIAARNADLNMGINRQIKRAILDSMINILVGIKAAEGKAIIDYISHLSSTGKCLIPGTTIRTTCPYAAFAGSALSQIHDGNDGNPKADSACSSYHPGRVIIPAALALALETEMTGADLVKAVAVGYDIAINAHNGPKQSPSDAYGSCAVSCYAFNFGSIQTQFALRVAGFNAPTSGAEDFETNNLTCAQQTRSGIETAMLVQSGYPTSEAKIPNSTGFGFSAPKYLGESVRDLYFKPYPSCRNTHYFIDAALCLRPKIIGNIDKIKQVRLYFPVSARDVAHIVGPGKYYKSYQFSIAYCTVAALIDGDFTIKQVNKNRTEDPTIQHLQSKICFIENAEFKDKNKDIFGNYGGAIEIIMTDGKIYSESAKIAKGDSQRPLSNEELYKKLVSWNGISDIDAKMLFDMVMKIDEYDNIEPLFDCLQLISGY